MLTEETRQRLAATSDTMPHTKLDGRSAEALSLPPAASDGAPIDVDFRLTCFHIGSVDTRAQTSVMRMGVVFYWTDPRMIGWTSPLLPPTLWGPEVTLRNAIGGAAREFEQFVVTDASRGRLKRIINFEATVSTPMQLEKFPFDVQDLTPEFVSISHWRQLDCARGGSLPHGQSYRLRQVQEEGEGSFFMMFFNGTISEWRLHSYRAKVTSTLNPAGFQMTLVAVRFHIVREYPFYLRKIVHPLIILTMGAHCSRPASWRTGSTAPLRCSSRRLR